MKMKWFAIVWLVLCAGLLLWLINASPRSGELWSGGLYGAWTLLSSVTTFILYGWDKRQARLDGWRVPEKRLHLLELVGGWPGAILGQQLLRHKSSKESFLRVFMGILALHGLFVSGVLYLMFSA